MSFYDDKVKNTDFSRLGLSQINEKRVSGIDIIKKYDKAFILGKPGSGKTTFLKYLALQCENGELFPDHVPVLINLKHFSDNSSNFNILLYIGQKFGYSLSDLSSSYSPIIKVLKSGKLFLLFDGLDEVKNEDSITVAQKIDQFSNDYDKNRFVITCRIAANKFNFKKFKPIEIADFNNEQIKFFVDKWFSKKEIDLSKDFIRSLNKNIPIKELASSPILLVLLCLVFEKKLEFPENRSEIYEDGISYLIEKWDASRGIIRTKYKSLSNRKKRDLLSYMAFSLFVEQKLFFKVKDVQKYIFDYLNSLSRTSYLPEYDDIEIEEFLHSIEAQHGLIVERAYNIFSFSHLTFHEYFTARYFSFSSNKKILIENLSNPNWREVFLLVCDMVADASWLIQDMQSNLVNILNRDKDVKKILKSIKNKADSISSVYDKDVIRSFYFEKIVFQELNISRDIPLTLALSSKIFKISQSWKINSPPNLNLYTNKNYSYALIMSMGNDIQLDFLIFEIIDILLTNSNDISSAVLRSIKDLIELSRNDQLKNSLTELSTPLNEPDVDDSAYWWRTDRYNWLKKFRQVTFEYRRVGIQYELTDQQLGLFKEIHYCTTLLIDCLNCDCSVNPGLRSSIYENLLLSEPA